MHGPDSTSISPDVLARLREWEGRSEIQHDEVTPAALRGLAATLDIDLDPAAGDELRALWHWLYFLPRAAQREIGVDGHPKLGGFLPPVPLPRRMWAGGRLAWHAPLRVGDRLQRTSRIVSVTHKPGRSGELIFVVLRHEIGTSAGLLLTEHQDLVYRAPQQPGDAPAPPSRSPQVTPLQATFSREVSPTAALLFRYSALTFNSHRIHYDRPYATSVEGYPGLVVQGPLLATLLADLGLRAEPGARVSQFSFRAVRPTTDLAPFRLCGRAAASGNGLTLWAQDHEGRLTMEADIQFH